MSRCPDLDAIENSDHQSVRVRIRRFGAIQGYQFVASVRVGLRRESGEGRRGGDINLFRRVGGRLKQNRACAELLVGR